MSATRIAQRYAKSLLDLATEQSKIDRVLQDAQSFAIAAQNRDLQLLLKSPIVPTDKKQQALSAVFGGSYDSLTLDFFKLIVEKSRESHLPEIMQAYQDLYRQRQHIVRVKLISAGAMSEAGLNAIQAKINEGMSGQTIELVTEVDSTLIGGFILDFGDKRYDASIANRLDQSRKAFSGTTV